MKKVVVSASALFLVLGVLTGCGEKEAPKAEAPQAEATKPEAAPASEQAAAEQVTPVMAPVAAPAPSSEPATAAADSAASDAAAKTADAATQAVAEVAQAVDGEKVYKGLCFSCHDSGIAGAPKLGDKAAWAPRIAGGIEALYASALNGKNAMPAKGGNPALSDAEVKAAVDFMVSEAQ